MFFLIKWILLIYCNLFFFCIYVKFFCKFYLDLNVYNIEMWDFKKVNFFCFVCDFMMIFLGYEKVKYVVYCFISCKEIKLLIL